MRYDHCHVSFSTISVITMTQGRLAWLMAVMIVFQSFTAVVEAHAFDQFEASAAAHALLHQAVVDDAGHTDATNSDTHETPLDHVLHCPHHGCHSPLFVSNGLEVHALVSAVDRSDELSDFKPDTPVSSLFRPPIA
jgi:hypothetical protein